MAGNIISILPANAFAIDSDTYVYEKDGYTIKYRIGSEWDNNRSVEVSIENTGEESILNWAMKLDLDGNAYNFWNSKLYNTNDDYSIIKNNGYNYEIEPGNTANFGFIVSDANDVVPEDIELCNKRITVTNGYDVDFNITSDWYTGFNGEITINNTSNEQIEAWTLTFDANYDIIDVWNAKLLSENEHSYEIANQLWTTPINPGESASFGFTADKSATVDAITENYKLTAVVVGETTLDDISSNEIDYELDSDEDGLPDYYEDILGTDKNKADTDNDGLTDGYEVFWLGTDPTKADSDDNGVNDGDEDPDNDGLSNVEESELGTDPNNADTDNDGLNDGEEVKEHHTDPLKFDTDEDGISDGDEITLKLDPNSSTTNGTPDSERIFPQIISSDSEALSVINNDEDTPFKVSLEMNAAGVAENNVSARISGYSNAIENSAIIGVAPEFVYTDGLTVDEITVKFELDNSIVDNTLGTYAAKNDGFKGIKRLMVFTFFEEINMLLPIETEYDIDNNIVYATIDKLGTYCLIDMEIFFGNLGIEPSGSDTFTAEIQPLTAMSNDNSKDSFDVAFIVGEICYTDEQLDSIKKEIKSISEIIFKNSSDVTISIYGLDGSGKTHSSWFGRSDNISGVEVMLDRIHHTSIQNEYNFVAISECIDYVTLAHLNSPYCDTREEYGFIFFNPEYKNSLGDEAYKYVAKSSRDDKYGKQVLELVNENGTDINFSTVTECFDSIEQNRNSYAKLLSAETNGVNIDRASYETVVNDCIEYIYGNKKPEVGIYKAIIATGYNTVVLDKPLTENDMHLAEKRYNNPDYVFSDDELRDCADTDGDGLKDFEEVMFYSDFVKESKFITFDNGVINLPHVADVMRIFEENGEYAYVDGGIEKAREQYGNSWAVFLTRPILPIWSDPTSEDGDKDDLPDGHDPLMLSVNNSGNQRSNFSKDNLNNLEQYNWVNYMYYDFTIEDNPYDIDYYYSLYNIDVKQAIETKSDIIILQKCLEYLGYLDMTSYDYNGLGQLINISKIDYGTLGGLSKAAIKLYQENHHLDSDSIIENEIIDDITFYSIILKASNEDYFFNEIDKKYDVEAHNFFGVNYAPKSYPMKAKENIDIKKIMDKDIYLYDLTVPLKKILRHGAKEFHEHSYFCLDMNLNSEHGITKTYVDSEKTCEYIPDFTNYIWLVLKVKNNAKYDIKTQKSWNDFFDIIDCEFSFHGSSYLFYFEEEVINAENFGNILYGFCCNAGNFSCDSIIVGGSVYSLLTEHSLDNPDDSNMIKKGYILFDKYVDNYNYVHGE